MDHRVKRGSHSAHGFRQQELLGRPLCAWITSPWTSADEDEGGCVNLFCALIRFLLCNGKVESGPNESVFLLLWLRGHRTVGCVRAVFRRPRGRTAQRFLPGRGQASLQCALRRQNMRVQVGLHPVVRGMACAQMVRPGLGRASKG